MWAEDIDSSLKKAGGDSNIVTLQAPTRDQVRAKLTELSKQAKPADAVVLMLIGHGSYDGAEYKFNIPGPDLSGAELASLLDHIPAQRQLVVNMTSSSGGSIEFLRKPNRVVISSTKSGSEKNATVFARYWAEALRDPAADTDKNESVSALEAFRFAQRKTTEFFDTQKRLATEHSVLEDTGKGEGEKDPKTENGQGRLASAFPLVRLGANAAAARDPEQEAPPRAQGAARTGHRQAEVREGRHAGRRVQEATDAAPAGTRQSAGGARTSDLRKDSDFQLGLAGLLVVFDCLRADPAAGRSLCGRPAASRMPTTSSKRWSARIPKTPTTRFAGAACFSIAPSRRMRRPNSKKPWR